MSTYDFCFRCGNNRKLPNGDICPKCVGDSAFEGFGDAKVCDFIPEDYARITFNQTMLPDSVDQKTASLMSEMCEQIPSLKWHSNIFLYSKPKSGKSVLAYTIITRLFKIGVTSFPYMDIQEIGIIARDINSGHAYKYEKEGKIDVHAIYESKYLFVRVNEVNIDTVSAMYSLLDRRSRRGNITIFLSVVTWASVKLADKLHKLHTIQGDGTLGTIKIIGGGPQ